MNLYDLIFPIIIVSFALIAIIDMSKCEALYERNRTKNRMRNLCVSCLNYISNESYCKELDEKIEYCICDEKLYINKDENRKCNFCKYDHKKPNWNKCLWFKEFRLKSKESCTQYFNKYISNKN